MKFSFVDAIMALMIAVALIAFCCVLICIDSDNMTGLIASGITFCCSVFVAAGFIRGGRDG